MGDWGPAYYSISKSQNFSLYIYISLYPQHTCAIVVYHSILEEVKQKNGKYGLHVSLFIFFNLLLASIVAAAVADRGTVWRRIARREEAIAASTT